MTVRDVKLSGDPKTWLQSLQGFIDDVVKALRGPTAAVPAIVVYKDFEYTASMGHYVDVDLGVTQRPRGIILVSVQEQGSEDALAGVSGLAWSWRNGHARINLGSAGIGTARFKVTMMVVL